MGAGRLPIVPGEWGCRSRWVGRYGYAGDRGSGSVSTKSSRANSPRSEKTDAGVIPDSFWTFSICCSTSFNCSSSSNIIPVSSFSFFVLSLSALLVSPASSIFIASILFFSVSDSLSFSFRTLSASSLALAYSISFSSRCFFSPGTAFSTSRTCSSVSRVVVCARLSASCRDKNFCFARWSAATCFSEARFRLSISERRDASAFWASRREDLSDAARVSRSALRAESVRSSCER